MNVYFTESGEIRSELLHVSCADLASRGTSLERIRGL